MKHSKITKCISPEEVRDSLVELQREIVKSMNDGGYENIQLEDKVEVPFGDLQFWHLTTRRLISFFA